MLLIAPVAVGLTLTLCSPAVGQLAQPMSAQPVTVDIDPYDPGPPVPQQFLGLSFEAAAISQIAQYTDRGESADDASDGRGDCQGQQQHLHHLPSLVR